MKALQNIKTFAHNLIDGAYNNKPFLRKTGHLRDFPVSTGGTSPFARIGKTAKIKLYALY
ncbi:MAG: hypothetical protein CVU09_07215 [Bacteroidetes bacterium HGW-Bacteroidetes-4]|jgi:hypothetical protein|nr:MAG: hypothetical protein CVU09_07215 [Bacteroidetes bacterium HGW-Bacteroidetes-4]